MKNKYSRIPGMGRPEQFARAREIMRRAIAEAFADVPAPVTKARQRRLRAAGRSKRSR